MRVTLWRNKVFFFHLIRIFFESVTFKNNFIRMKFILHKIFFRVSMHLRRKPHRCFAIYIKKWRSYLQPLLTAVLSLSPLFTIPYLTLRLRSQHVLGSLKRSTKFCYWILFQGRGHFFLQHLWNTDCIFGCCCMTVYLLKFSRPDFTPTKWDSDPFLPST